MKPGLVPIFAVGKALAVGACFSLCLLWAVGWLQRAAGIRQWEMTDREVGVELIIDFYWDRRGGYFGAGNPNAVHDMDPIYAATTVGLRHALDRNADGRLTAQECADWLEGSGLDALLARDDVKPIIADWRRDMAHARAIMDGLFANRVHLSAEPGSELYGVLMQWGSDHLKWVDRAAAASAIQACAQGRPVPQGPFLQELDALCMIVRVARTAEDPRAGIGLSSWRNFGYSGWRAQYGYRCRPDVYARDEQKRLLWKGMDHSAGMDVIPGEQPRPLMTWDLGMLGL